MPEPRIVTLDIETQAATALVFGQRNQDIGNIQIIKPDRVIGIGAKWHHANSVMWRSEYHHGKDVMVNWVRDLVDEADIVVHFNGTTFDMPWINREIAMAGLAIPSPVLEVDLLKTVRRKFRFMSNKLENVVRMFGLDAKMQTGGFKLWRDIEVGTPDEQEKAWRTMRRYCITPDHKLLGEDLRWRPASEFQVGDAVLGFDEDKPKGHGRQYARAEIKSISRTIAPLYRVTFASGKSFRVTGDHKWLVANPRQVDGKIYNWEWKETEELLVNGSSVRYGKRSNASRKSDAIPQLFPVWEEDMSKEAGWLAGMLDGEGSVSVRRNKGQRSAGGLSIYVAQKPGPESDRLEHLIKELYGKAPATTIAAPRGPISRNPIQRMVFPGSMYEKIDFLGRVRPERLIAKVDFDNLGRLEARNGMDYVVSVERTLDDEIVMIETSTGTFIADGYPMHNCKNDVLIEEQLYDFLKGWIVSHPNVALFTEEDACRNCGGTDLVREGYAYTAEGKFQRYHCAACGKWDRSRRRVVGTADLQVVAS